jgi:glycosyltransferase involved in cell wall biosynthesis/tetratricopeptide (TPR) repeat protein/precorrin-6B methylase 2
MKTVEIDRKSYTVFPTEFQQAPNIYSTLVILDRVGEFDRVSSLVSEISKITNCKSAVFGAPTHGGYIPLNASIENSFVFDCTIDHQQNMIANGGIHFTYVSNLDTIKTFAKSSILLVESYNSKYDSFVQTYSPIIISNNPFMRGYNSYSLSNTSWIVLVPHALCEVFCAGLCPMGPILYYDNIINLCVMVKNGGDEFVSMLQTNLPFIDRWTILDTGSTDNTVENVRRIMVNKPGNLYQEPFINFGVSRNRCLELAGTSCTYNIMLDDTYHLKENIREFLKYIRGDQYADSFSLYITQNDIAYASNRIFKSKKNLKYNYSIHEVIQENDNVNVIIPKDRAYIYDEPSDKLVIRTANRKQQDIDMLQQEIEKNPDDPRPYYYMAQTYTGMNKPEKAYEWFIRRIEHVKEGFQQEKHEACLEAGRIAQFTLQKDSVEYLKWYELACLVDNERPDALYFIGHYYLTIGNDIKKAFTYLKRGYQLGYPEHRQYCLKPSITYTHIPKLLTMCCYDMEEYLLGQQVSAFYLKNNKADQDIEVYTMVDSWNKIFNLLVHTISTYDCKVIPTNYSDLPICCIISPCGLYNWTGSDILKKGMGGSESFTVEMATQIQKNGKFIVVVFCNCEKEEIFNGVRYIPLIFLGSILQTHYIHTCIISRYSEYIPFVMKYHVENMYLMAHDVAFSGNVIPISNKLKGVFCLSPWHASHIEKLYPPLKSVIKLVGHGVHLDLLDASNKVPYKFIYSSLANRGLCELLKMWPRIIEWKSMATLHIYSDINSSFMVSSFPTLMNEIRELLTSVPNVFYHGCVSKSELYESWKTADVWFYPTSFSETFCVTALEAAASKTLAVATNLAGLQYTVGDRGILFEPTYSEEQVFQILKDTLENDFLKKYLIDRNYKWAKTNTWVFQATQMEQYLLENRVEIRDNYSETSKRDTMNRILQNVTLSGNILEIGDQTGVLLIEMIHEIPNAKAIVIDKWNDHMKQSFNNNIIYAGIKDRVTLLEMETLSGLMELNKRDNAFDLIYVNTNSIDMQLYNELAVAWEILNKNGILIVELLEERKPAIWQFMKDKHTINQDVFMAFRK